MARVPIGGATAAVAPIAVAPIASTPVAGEDEATPARLGTRGSAADDGSVMRGRVVVAGCLLLVFVVAFGARLLAHDVIITADEDNWMRRAGGFTFGLVNGQFGRTYQNGHPGVTTMWVAMVTLGQERMIQYADRVHGLRLVGQVPGFWDALVDARLGFAAATASLVALIAGLTWRLLGMGSGLLAGLVAGLEPFYLAISQLVHMDAILSGSMVASMLAALVAWQGRGGRGWLALSGALAGIALLSKIPAVFLLAFVPLLGVALRWGATPSQPFPASGEGFDSAPRTAAHPAPPPRLPSPSRGRAGGGVGPTTIALDLAVWGAAFLATFVLLWPAIWTLGPVEVLGRVAQFARETGGQPHEQGTFFLGEPRADPGPLFYPLALAFRVAPLTMLGLALLTACWRWVSAEHRRVALALLAYALGFLLMMTLGAKKFDRYVLPMLPALGVVAGIGLWAGFGALRGRLANSARTRAPVGTLARAPAVMFAIGVVALAVWPLIQTYPYFLSYYTPLLGGGAVAQRAVMIGNGEGLDQVAVWLNARPNAADLWVESHSFDVLQPLIVASGAPLRDRVPSNADYVVLYRFQMQIGHSPRVVAEYSAREPEHVVRIGNVEYARIYRGPKQLRAAGAPVPGVESATSGRDLRSPTGAAAALLFPSR